MELNYLFLNIYIPELNPEANPRPIAKYKSFLSDGNQKFLVKKIIIIPILQADATSNSFPFGIKYLNLRPNKKAKP